MGAPKDMTGDIPLMRIMTALAGFLSVMLPFRLQRLKSGETRGFNHRTHPDR